MTLELLPEDAQDADPALITALGRETITTLQEEGYRVQPVSTGTRGGILVEVINAATTAYTFAQTHKDQLDELSDLCQIGGTIIPVCVALFASQKKQAVHDSVPPAPIKITAEIDGAPVSVEAPDLEDAEAALKLAQRFQQQHPALAAKVTRQSKTKVTGRVAKRHHRRRR